MSENDYYNDGPAEQGRLLGCFVWYHAAMHTFFHGWRRKLGVVTLVMACLLLVLWARSQTAADTVRFAVSERSHSLVSADGRISWDGVSWATAQELYGASPPFFQSKPMESPAKYKWFKYKMTPPRVYFSRFKGANYVEWRISHLYLVCPLTLLAAYLILWKPRKGSSPN